MTCSISVVGCNNFTITCYAEIKLVITSGNEKHIFVLDPYCDINEVFAVSSYGRTIGRH